MKVRLDKDVTSINVNMLKSLGVQPSTLYSVSGIRESRGLLGTQDYLVCGSLGELWLPAGLFQKVYERNLPEWF